MAVVHVIQSGSFTFKTEWSVYVKLRVADLRVKRVAILRITEGGKFTCNTVSQF